MTGDDVPLVEELTADTFHDLEVTTRPPNWPPAERRPREHAQGWITRLQHLTSVDPGGCFVAEGDGSIEGAAAALVREGMWALAILAVRPGQQARGVGRSLLDAALGHGAPGCPGMICSSHDPRAVRRYRLAGFDLHPTMLLWGIVPRSVIPALPHVRQGSGDDVELLDDIDRATRGFAHGVDHQVLMSQFALQVYEAGPRRGYAYGQSARGVHLLAASDPEAATTLLWATLAQSDPETPFSFHHVTGEQSWAIDVGLAAGMEVHSRGFLALRAMPVPAPYLPSGHFL